MTQMDSTVLTEARGWLADCDFLNADGSYMSADDHAELSDADVLRMVDRHYAGALKAFRAEVVA
jgi:hypothetical protein